MATSRGCLHFSRRLILGILGTKASFPRMFQGLQQPLLLQRGPSSPPCIPFPLLSQSCFSTQTPTGLQQQQRQQQEEEENHESSGAFVGVDEARRLLRLVNVEALKKRLETDGNDCMPYADLLQLCQTMGVVSSVQQATEFARTLDEAGVVLIFREKVYLHPQQVAELVANAVTLPLIPMDDPCSEELEKLERQKKEIDRIARRQVRTLLWSGFGFLTLQTALSIRLTFWEFSWDVMEPVLFFVTTGGLLAGYTYFLFTSRDPTYKDFMKRLFLSKQKKLIKKMAFDIKRYSELERQYKAGRKPCHSGAANV